MVVDNCVLLLKPDKGVFLWGSHCSTLMRKPLVLFLFCGCLETIIIWFSWSSLFSLLLCLLRAWFETAIAEGVSVVYVALWVWAPSTCGLWGRHFHIHHLFNPLRYPMKYTALILCTRKQRSEGIIPRSRSQANKEQDWISNGLLWFCFSWSK